jgi:WD40 repeat protein
VLDAQSCETVAVGSVDEGITDVVEVKRSAGYSSASAKEDAGPGSEVWCVHGSSVLGCWDTKTYSSGRCTHVGHMRGGGMDGRVCGLVALPNGQVWMGSYDGRIVVWNSKNKRVIRKLGQVGEPVSSMVVIDNHLLGVLTVWVSYFDGSVCVWVASDLDTETLLLEQAARQAWKRREEDLSNIKALRDTVHDAAHQTDGNGCVLS